MKFKTPMTILIALNVLFLGALAAELFFINRTNVKARDVQADVLVASEKSDRLYSIEVLLHDTRGGRTSIDRSFVTQSNIVDFIEKLESLGRSAGVSFSINTVEPDKKTKVLHASVSSSGRFERVFNLISLIENMPGEVSLSRVSLSKGALIPLEKDPNTWSSSINFDVTSFLKK